MKQLVSAVVLLLILTGPLSAQKQVFKPAEVNKPVYFDVSPPLRDMPLIKPEIRDRGWKNGVIENEMELDEREHREVPRTRPGDYKNAQRSMGTRGSTLLSSVEGVSNLNGVLPPDTQGDVGPNHYMQMINISFAIWNKAGTLVYGPADNKTLWNGFPGPWSGSNDGDPVVLYDDQADRWVASQFALPNYPSGPFYELIAVSQTGDPTGSWYRYAYTFTNMPDYPKLGVWRDGYYLAVNSFTSGSLNWAGTGVAALERDKMLIGDPDASMIFFTTPSGGDPSSFMPADCDGAPAPEGSPALFGYMRDGNPDRFVLYSLHTDWDTPTNSTFTQLITLPVDAFSSNISGGIPQKGTSTSLQAVSDRLMYRLQYRNFGTYQAMVANHTVNVSGHAGIRWYEFRNSGSGWEVYQQGTYSPDDTYRWMGSVAMNSYGDIALGYSASSSTLFPSIRFTGRHATDPLGEMTFTEQDIVAGGGSQTSFYQRWGDYSMMSVDPSVDSVFWYTQEYYTSTSNQNWKTRIGSFSFGVPLVATATVDKDTICLGETIQLHAEVSGAPGDVTYFWSSFPGSFTSSLPDPVDTPTATTVYHLTVISNGNTANSSVTVVVNPVPTVSVSGDAAVCGASPAAVSAVASGHIGLLWTTSGDGTFADPEMDVTDYQPGPQDIVNAGVTLYASALSASGCEPAKDSLLLSVISLPDVDAGDATTICAGEPVRLFGSAANFNTLLWTTSGDGTFSDPSSPGAVYTPGTGDLENGSTDLVLTAEGNAPCGPVTDTVTVTIVPAPSIDAGGDFPVCEGEAAQISAVAANTLSLLWQTSGDGTFADETSAATTYMPGASDLVSGQVTLTVTASANAPCNEVSDQLVLTVNALPVATAGNDTTICKTSGIVVKGIAGNAESHYWSTSGNGVFDDPAALVTMYYPGVQDTTAGFVELTLNVTGANGCGEAADVQLVQFADCLGIEPLGTARVNIHPNPTQGKFMVEISGLPENHKLDISVTDARGNLISGKQYISEKTDFRTVLDLSAQSKGIYLLKIVSGNEATTAKIILQ